MPPPRRSPPRRLASLVLLSAFALACQATFVRPAVAPGRVQTRWTHYFLLGLVGEANLDARDLCAGGRARSVRTYGTLGTSLLTLVSGGIYAPRKIEVTCEGR